MSKFNRNDEKLLVEAYGTQLLKENFPQMTLAQVKGNIELMSESDQQWVCEFSDRVIEELFGGLKALGGNAMQAATKGLQNVASSAKSGLQNAATKSGQAIGNAASGAVAAGKKVAQNVGDKYAAGEQDAASARDAKSALDMITQLQSMIQSAQQKGLVTFSGDPMTMPLKDVVDQLLLASKGANQLNNSQQKSSAFAGAGKAFKSQFGQ